MLKSKEENPNGLHNKYVISRTDGTPMNPANVYFILKVDMIRNEKCTLLAIKKLEREIEQLNEEVRKDSVKKCDHNFLHVETCLDKQKFKCSKCGEYI